MTGRYEMTEGTHNKFWDLRKTKNGYEATWGKIGNKEAGPKVYDESEALKVVNAKLKKGYQLVEAHR